ncbi:MAG: AraC family transcriptional regulator [Acetivibrio sp.]
MERQKDWFTGSNYYDNYIENEIIIEKRILSKPTPINRHEMVEIIYVMKGKGIFFINGMEYHIEQGSFFCLYSHHFHSILTIEENIEIMSVKFYIGLFMHMCWEKHPKNAHERLVYDTCPLVFLKGKEREEIEHIMDNLWKEQKERRFESKNLIGYMTLVLHAYHCRYAFENIGKDPVEQSVIWKIIEQAILYTSNKLSLEDMTENTGLSKQVLNQKIKQNCGLTFFQLQQYGKILNACALLHFSELSLDYISDILGFSSITAFYRVFVQYAGMTPRDYQKKEVGNLDMIKSKEGLALQFLQYMHLHFQKDISLKTICEEFCVKEYTARQMIQEIFNRSFKDLLNEIRVSYACSYLKATQKNVVEISNLCGFNSYSTFQRTFQQCMNQTPKEYRDN